MLVNKKSHNRFCSLAIIVQVLSRSPIVSECEIRYTPCMILFVTVSINNTSWKDNFYFTSQNFFRKQETHGPWRSAWLLSLLGHVWFMFVGVQVTGLKIFTFDGLGICHVQSIKCCLSTPKIEGQTFWPPPSSSKFPKLSVSPHEPCFPSHRSNLESFL